MAGLILAFAIPTTLLFSNIGGEPVLSRMAAVAAMMAILWVTEAIPLAATALMPLVLFPLLGIASSKAVASHYMNSTVFLLVGGFMIALAMQRWSLHKRIALNVLVRIGSRPARLMAGFIVTSAGLSMWISNTATTLMMLPIAMAIISRFETTLSASESQRFAVGLLLAIAYSASVGGMMTPIGTAPNLVFLRLYELNHSVADSIGFAQWMVLTIPVGLTLLSVIAIYLGWYFMRDLPASDALRQVVREEREQLGPMSHEEKIVMIAFAVTALLWITRKDLALGELMISGWQNHFALDQVDDATIAIGMSLLLFLIPARNSDGSPTRILDGEVFTQLPWSIVLLFGGGFALAYGFVESGLSRYLVSQMSGLDGANQLIMMTVTATGMTFLTELTSNTATTQLVLPILQTVAESINLSPLWLMLPATLSASCAFMFPVATPPNAIIFSSGKVRVMDMVKAGFLLNMAGILIIVAVMSWLIPILFDV